MTHPSAEALEAFGLGKLDDPSADAILQHLDSCADCRSAVAALSGDDFLARLRQAQGGSSTPAPAKTLNPVLRAAKPSPADTRSAPIHDLPAELANNPQYEVLRELGRGGMGVVYLAKNKLLDRLEVLKVINRALLDRPGAVERFLREIRSAAKLTHANVVTAYSAVQQGQLLAFAMEYVDGSDLATVVNLQGPLPVPHACFYVQQAAWALQHAFEKQMVHRDIKPQNLILARDGKKHIVKILDFGLAKATQEKKGENLALTRSGQMMGTPDYIAPEQSLDAASADIRADIYSLGCTLYFLLSGQPPFSGNSLAGLLLAHQMDEAKPLNLVRPEVPEELAAVVRKMMAKDLAKRYQIPADVAQALGPFIKSGAAAGPAASSPALSQAIPSPTKHKEVKSAPPIAAVAAVAPEETARERGSPFAFGRLAGIAKSTEPRKGAKARAGIPVPRRLLAMGGWAGGCLLLLACIASVGLIVGGILRVRTNHGTVVLEDLPPGADVTVDGDGVTVDVGDGNAFEVRVAPGRKHRLQVTKQGFKVFGKEVEVAAGKRGPYKCAWNRAWRWFRRRPRYRTFAKTTARSRNPRRVVPRRRRPPTRKSQQQTYP